MANQRKPHEQDVLLSAVERTFVGYFGANGQIGTGIPAHERPAEPPIGAVYEQEYVLYQDIELEDGSILKLQQLQPEKIALKKFLRGRVVTDRKEVMTLLMPIVLQELVIALGALVRVEGGVPAAVAVKQTDGTEIGIPLQDGDIPPPEGASPYAVGESPEELMVAEAQAYAERCQDYLDSEDEVEQIRRNVKDGVYDDEEEAAVGGGHPVIPLDSDDDPRVA